MADAIWRYEIPVDDRWHPLQLSGEILHVGCRNPHAVEVWARHTDGASDIRSFRVYGTGQSMPDNLEHVGTALAPGGQLVWHLMETA